MIIGRRSVFDNVVATLRAAGCVFAEDEARLLIESADDLDELNDLLHRRVAGFPLEQLLGWAEFCQLRIAVVPGVFVPRRRTEFLVRQALDVLSRTAADRPAAVVDLCCGTGAVGLAVLTALRAPHPAGGAPPRLAAEAALYACDIDPVAVACAQANITAVGGIACHGDLFEALPDQLRGRVNLIVCNAPYVPTDAIELMPPEARDHEPRIALDGGPDGADVHRRVAAEAADWLMPGGSLLIETSRSQADATRAALDEGGLHTRVARSDEHEATVAIATMIEEDRAHVAAGR